MAPPVLSFRSVKLADKRSGSICTLLRGICVEFRPPGGGHAGQSSSVSRLENLTLNFVLSSNVKLNWGPAPFFGNVFFALSPSIQILPFLFVLALSGRSTINTFLSRTSG